MDCDLDSISELTTTCCGEAPTPAATACRPKAESGPSRRVQGPDRRQEKRVDRRSGLDRRQLSAEQSNYSGPERRSGEDRRNSLESPSRSRPPTQ